MRCALLTLALAACAAGRKNGEVNGQSHGLPESLRAHGALAASGATKI